MFFPFFFIFLFFPLFLHFSFRVLLRKKEKEECSWGENRPFGHSIPLVPLLQTTSSGWVQPSSGMRKELESGYTLCQLPAKGTGHCFSSRVFSLLGNDKECVFQWFLWKLLCLLQKTAKKKFIFLKKWWFFINHCSHLGAGWTSGWVHSLVERAIGTEWLRLVSWTSFGFCKALQKTLGSFQFRVGKALKCCTSVGWGNYFPPDTRRPKIC